MHSNHPKGRKAPALGCANKSPKMQRCFLYRLPFNFLLHFHFNLSLLFEKAEKRGVEKSFSQVLSLSVFPSVLFRLCAFCPLKWMMWMDDVLKKLRGRTVWEMRGITQLFLKSQVGLEGQLKMPSFLKRLPDLNCSKPFDAIGRNQVFFSTISYMGKRKRTRFPECWNTFRKEVYACGCVDVVVVSPCSVMTSKRSRLVHLHPEMKMSCFQDIVLFGIC